jgi:hypothetical protein
MMQAEQLVGPASLVDEVLEDDRLLAVVTQDDTVGAAAVVGLLVVDAVLRMHLHVLPDGYLCLLQQPVACLCCHTLPLTQKARSFCPRARHRPKGRSRAAMSRTGAPR